MVKLSQETILKIEDVEARNQAIKILPSVVNLILNGNLVVKTEK